MPMVDVAALRIARLDKGLSARALAKHVRISESHLSHIAAGRKGASPAVLVRLAKALDVPLRDLLREVTAA